MSLPISVRISGHGIAAFAAAVVLHRAGIHAEVPPNHSASRFVTLNESTRSLFADLFGDRLLPTISPVSRRIVDWSEEAGPVDLNDDGGLTIDLADLHTRLREALGPPLQDGCEAGPKINAQGREANGRIVALPDLVTAYWSDVPTMPSETIFSGEMTEMVQAGGTGWTFVAVRPGGKMFAQATVLSGENGVTRASAALAANLSLANAAALPSPDHVFDTAPLLGRAIGPGPTLFAGDAAIAFDPLCGDGCGHALRSGVMAAAALVRMLKHPDEKDSICAWYRDRLVVSMIVHLEACAALYERARFADSWSVYIASLRREAGRLRLLLTRMETAYRLVDTALVREWSLMVPTSDPAATLIVSQEFQVDPGNFATYGEAVSDCCVGSEVRSSDP